MPKIRSPENDAEGDGTDPKGMPLNKRLYKLLGDHGPQIGAVVGLLTIGGFGWVGLTWLFAEPDLSVEVSSSEVRLPSALHRQLIEALEPYSSESEVPPVAVPLPMLDLELLLLPPSWVH